MPGIVQSVNLTAMTCDVQIAINGTVANPDGTFSSVVIKPLLDVPIVFPSAGGFTLTLPVAENDEVLVVLASRCIDAWWALGGIQRPMETRMHDLSDGFAIPGPKSQPNVIGGISSTAAQLRNNAGTTYLEISADGKIKIVSPSEIDITAPLAKITGNLVVTGTIMATGEVTSGVIPLSAHLHGGVTPGTGTTGVPVP